MKRITFLTLLFALLMIPFSYGQSFTSSGVGEIDRTVVNTTKTVVNPTIKNRQANLKGTSAIITHSATQNITAGNSVTCNAAGVPADNFFYRDFDLANDFGITNDFDVTSVEFGLETTSGAYSITLNVYSTPGPFPGAALTLQGTAVAVVDVPDTGTVVSVPLTATIPAGEIMVYEMFFPDDQGIGDVSVFPGSNPDGQTGTSWIAASACGLSTPTDVAAIGFPGMHLVMNVIGDEVIVVPPTTGEELYALYPWDDEPNNVAKYSYDPVTDAISLDAGFVGNTGVAVWSYGFDYNPLDGLVYLLGGDVFGTPRNLYTYDINTSTTVLIEQVISVGGNNKPQDMTFGGDGTLYFLFQSGEINAYDVGTQTMSAFATVPTGGAVGLTYDFDNNQLIYALNTGPVNLYTVAIPSATVAMLFNFDTPGVSGCTAQAIEYVGDNKAISSSTFGCSIIYTVDLATQATSLLLNPTGSYSSIKDLMFMGNVGGPTISCPDDVVADSEPGVCGAVVNFADASAIDLEDGPLPTVQTAGTPLSGEVFPIGVTIVEFSATDSDGNTSTCQFTVTVNDVEAPMAMCQDITVELDAAGMAVITEADIDNGSSDNCTGFTMALDVTSFTCADVGENTVTLTVTDASGLTDSCTAIVTVEDNQAPVIACMGESSVPCDHSNPSNAFENGRGCNASNGWTAANDLIVDADVDFTLNQVSANIFLEVGSAITSVDVFYYDDNAGVPGTVIGSQAGVVPTSQNVVGSNFGFDVAEVILDVTAFTFASQAGIPTTYWVGISTSNNATGDLRNFWEVSTASAVGNGLAFEDGTGYIIPAATEDGVYTFYGMCEVGGTPPLEVVLDADGMATVNAMDLLFSVDDNCSTTATFGSGGGVSGSLTTLFAAGNNGSPGGAVYFDVTVGPTDITVNSIDINTADAGAFTMDVYALMGTYVGNEGNAGAWGTPINASGTGAGLDTPSNAILDTPVVLTAGNTYGMALVLDATHAHHYTNGDGSNESFSNADLTMDLGAASNVPFDGSPFSPRVFNGTINYETGGGETMDFDCSMLGENSVEVTVTDAGGNEATCTATVLVLDETAPVLVCGPEPLLYGSNSVSDSPGLVIDAANSLITTIITVTDDFTITDLNVMLDISHSWSGDIAATITSPAGTSVNLFQQIGAPPFGCSEADIIATLDDEATSPIEGACPVNGTYQPDNALTAFDGENTVGDWTLTIEDTYPALDDGMLNSWGLEYEYSYPNPNTDLFIELGADGTVTIEPMDVLSTLDEACEIDVMLIDITDFTCDDIGTPTLVTVFANDTSGNFASCQVEVNIVDNMEPTLTCPGNTTAPFDPATGLYVLPDYFDLGDAFATDNCTDAAMLVLTQDPAPGTSLPATTGTPHIVTFTAEDEYGNIATCSMEIDVAVVGVEENELLASALSMYPNPTTDQVTLVNSSTIGLEAAMIYDLNGKLVAEFDLSNMQNETTFDVSNFASGVFMVKIIGENASTVKRLIKK